MITQFDHKALDRKLAQTHSSRDHHVDRGRRQRSSGFMEHHPGVQLELPPQRARDLIVGMNLDGDRQVVNTIGEHHLGCLDDCVLVVPVGRHNHQHLRNSETTTGQRPPKAWVRDQMGQFRLLLLEALGLGGVGSDPEPLVPAETSAFRNQQRSLAVRSKAELGVLRTPLGERFVESADLVKK